MAYEPERTTQAQRDFAQASQAPAPFDDLGSNGEPTAQSATTAKLGGGLTWADRLARAKLAAAVSGPAENVNGMIGQRIDLIGAKVTAMEGGNKQFSYNLRGTLLRDGEPPLAIYGMAGVESIVKVIEELGEGPWPHKLPFLIDGAETRWTEGQATQPRLVPLW